MKNRQINEGEGSDSSDCASEVPGDPVVPNYRNLYHVI